MKVKVSLRKKAVFAIILITIILASVVVTISYSVYSRNMEEYYRQMADNVAQTAANILDKEQIEKYTSMVKEIYLKNPCPEWASEEEELAYYAQYDGVRDEGFQEIFQKLEQVKTANKVLFLYVIYIDLASRSGVYVVDADNSDMACPPGTWDVVYDQNYERLVNAPLEGFSASISNTEEYGWLCSTGKPILDEDGNIIAHVMVDLSMDEVVQERHGFLIFLNLVLWSIIIVLVLLTIYIVDRAVVTPINSLAKAASIYIREREEGQTENGQSSLQRLEIHTGDEVENLAVIFKQMELDIEDYIKNLTSVTAEKERIGAELSVATQIQADLLPSIFPAFPERKEFDIFASMAPAKEVGGDFYDFFLIGEDRLAVVIADVSGKGVPAALFMVIAKTLIKNHLQNGELPMQAFTNVNDQLCENNKEGLFVTAWMGVLTLSTGELTYVNAGHNPPLIKRGNGGYEYFRTTPDLVLAAMDGIPYHQGSVTLQKGDMLYLYTDGVTEAARGENGFYGEERLAEVLNAHREASPRELIAAVKEDVAEYAADTPQSDDITMLCVKYNETTGNR